MSEQAQQGADQAQENADQAQQAGEQAQETQIRPSKPESKQHSSKPKLSC